MTKQERNAIYRAALDQYIEVEQHWKNGMCAAINEVRGYNQPDPYWFIEEYPEILKHKPAHVGAGDYWWCTSTPEGKQKRIDIFTQAINETL